MTLTVSRRVWAGWAAATCVSPWLAACGGGTELQSDREQDYAEAVQALMKTYPVPGAVVAVQVPGARTWQGAYGLTDPQRQQAMSLDAAFFIRSVTKSFTVTLLLQLASEGRLALSDKIGEHVSGVPNGDLISLADLAANQSGLVDYSQTSAFQEALGADLRRVWSPDELLALAFAEPPTFLPGERYQYCNTNTVLLGRMLEGLTGEPLEALLRQRIFTPLGLNNTWYPSTPDLRAPMAQPHILDVQSGAFETIDVVSPSALAGSGGMASSLNDLLVWGEALGQGTLLGPQWQARRVDTARAATNGPEYQRYGLGIGQIGRWWGHTGSGLGYQVATLHHPTRQATIAVLMNTSVQGGRRDLNLAQELFQALAEVVEEGSTAAQDAPTRDSQ